LDFYVRFISPFPSSDSAAATLLLSPATFSSTLVVCSICQ